MSVQVLMLIKRDSLNPR